MKLFGNEVSKKVQRDLIVRLIMIIISGGIIVVFAINSVAWFSGATRLSVTGMKIVVDCGTFEIAVLNPRSAEYDRYESEEFYRPYNSGTDGGMDRFNIAASQNASGIYVETDSEHKTITIKGSPSPENDKYYRWAKFPDDDAVDHYNIVVTANADGAYVQLPNSAGATITLGGATYSGMRYLKEYLADEGYTLTGQYTDNADPIIAFEMINEYAFTRDGQTTYYLMPGSYGTIEFYILPKSGVEETDSKYDFTLDLMGYVYKDSVIKELEVDIEVDPEAEPEVQAEQTEQRNKQIATIASLENILQGHMLFFTNKTTTPSVRYSGLITGGAFEYTATDADWTENIVDGKNGYHVTIYWTWPMTYDEINTSLYTSEVTTYVNAHPEYFFDADSEAVEGLSDERLSDLYNNCDQLIGDNYNYLVMYMTATKGADA